MDLPLFLVWLGITTLLYFARVGLQGPSEKHLQGKLDLPGRRVDQRRRDRTESCDVHLRGRLSENRVIEDIEELRPELGLSPLGRERNVLHQREIERAHSRTDEGISRGVAERV